MRRLHPLIASVCGLLLIAACSNGGGDGATNASTDASGSPATSAAAAADSNTPSEPPPALPPVIDGLEQMTLLTPVAGGGPRPLLAWQPIPDAVRYTVVVYDAEGQAIWSSLTTNTEIYLGGTVPIPEENSGPRISTDNTWVVYADDASGRLIAASGRSPISP